MPEVVLADGDNANGLASMLGTLLAQNVERSPQKFEDFRRVESSVLIEVSDLDQAITLSFIGDRCTIHNGSRGRCRVRIRTDAETLMGLSQLHIGRLGLPNYFDDNGKAILRAMSKGRLRIGGMHHLATLNRITRLFSVA
jgi:hypothetical protein